MLIRELLEQKPGPSGIRSIRPESTLLETAHVLMVHEIGALLVLDEDEILVGVISERDLVRSISKFDARLFDCRVGDVMSRPVITCTPDQSVAEVLSVMNSNRISHIPVVEGRDLMGVISTREFNCVLKKLQAQAHSDGLTGLSNRRYFMETLDKELGRFHRFASPLSLAMLDIDHFKRINDTFGHAAGDEVLRKLADLLVRKLRPFDGVGRIGGEEFALLFPGTGQDKARRICDRLIAAIRELGVDTGNGQIRLTVSIGLTSARTECLDSDAILKTADKLLYEAKAGGRDRLVWENTAGRLNPPDLTRQARQKQRQRA